MAARRDRSGKKQPLTTGMRKAEKLAFKNTDKISKQGNKEKISGSVKTLKKTIKATTKLEVRGKKPTLEERQNRARDLQFARMEKRYDSALPAVGLRGGPDAQERGPKGKNLRKREAIRKEASLKIPKKVPVKPKGGMGGGGLFGGGAIRKSK